MDPTTTLIWLLEAIAEGDDEMTIEHLDNLLAWVRKGGFLPSEVAREMVEGIA